MTSEDSKRVGALDSSIEEEFPTLAEILAILRKHRDELDNTFATASLGVFGSAVRHEAGSASDIDILVEFHTAPTLFKFVRLQRRLSELFGRPVNLVIVSGLKPRIGERILSEVVTA